MSKDGKLMEMVNDLALTSSIIIIIIGCIMGLWLWCIYDMAKSDFEESNNKVVWCLLLCVLAPIGTALYLILGRSQKKFDNIYRNMISNSIDEKQREPKPY